MATPTTNTASVTFIDEQVASLDELVQPLVFDTKWGGALGTGVELQYSFPGESSSSAFFTPNYGFDELDGAGWYALSGPEREAVVQAITQAAMSADITFVKVEDNATIVGDLRFTGSNNISSFAHAYLPWGTPEGGDAWFSADWNAPGDAIPKGSYDYLTILHELGHTLGLDHPFDKPDPLLSLPVEYDHYGYTIMSYTVKEGDDSVGADFYPTTYMYLDLLALQALYGPSTTANLGDTTYTYQGDQQYWETIVDSGGVDVIVYNAATGGWIDLSNELSHFSHMGQPIEFTDGSTTRDTIAIGPGVIIENATGGNGNDTILGNGAGNVLRGRAGSDSLLGAGGDDTITAAGGNDNVFGSAGNDSLLGGGGSDTLQAAGGNDTLNGGSGADSILGGAGDDVLDGGEGSDTLGGGNGEDTVQFGDAVALGDADFEFMSSVETLRLLADVDGQSVMLGAFADAAGLRTIDAGALLTSTHGAFADASGSTANLVFLGGAGEDTVLGGSGNDSLLGKGGSDSVDGGDGDDTLTAAGGNDILLGGNGSDSILGGAGADTLVGGEGDDRLQSSSENDSLDGGNGEDTLTAAGGNDTLLGGAGDDSLVGGSGNDTLEGGNGDDTIDGGAGDDVFLLTAVDLVSGDVIAGDADVALNIDAGDVLDITDELAAMLTVGGATIGDGDTIEGIEADSNIWFILETQLLMIDVNGDDTFIAGDDFSIDLIGVESVTYDAATSSFSFTLT